MPDRRNILEIWSKVFGDLEKTYLVIFGENVSAIWRNRSATFEKTVWRYWRERVAEYVGELEETCSALWRKRVRRFGENVFGDFGENFFGDFWR